MAYNNQPYYSGYYPQYNSGAMPDMLNQFKGQYQQPIPQMQQNMAQPMQQNFQQMPMQTPTQQNDPQKSSSGFIWVQGPEGAKGFLVAPNNTVILWDTESPTIYVKSADASGIPSMRVLDFKERSSNASQTAENAPITHECKCGSKFVPKADFEALEGKYQEILCRLSDIEEKYNILTAKSIAKTSKKAEVE